MKQLIWDRIVLGLCAVWECILQVSFFTGKLAEQNCSVLRKHSLRFGAPLHDPEIDRSPTTIELYLDNLRIHVLPRWGQSFLGDVKAVQVETWLRSLKLAPSTKAKLRSHLSALFNHAIRHELFVGTNPITTVRQSSKRLKTPDILTLEEMKAILGRIEAPEHRLMILIAAVTTCRRSEIRGLKWRDFDYDQLFLHFKRGKVRKH